MTSDSSRQAGTCGVLTADLYKAMCVWSPINDTSIESVNKSKSCPALWQRVWEDLISKQEHLSVTQWVSFATGHWFLTEFICYIAQYVSALLHRAEERENIFQQHMTMTHMLNYPQSIVFSFSTSWGEGAGHHMQSHENLQESVSVLQAQVTVCCIYS